MLRVQTTVVVGPDRQVTLRLPASLPIGRHTITVVIDGAITAIGDGPDAEDVIGYDYDEAQGAAFDVVYHVN
ncbi:MAG TPA: hypothetical protein VEL07_07905 [Planctomycetota bacterium]|nr:hypothetical protein [Planctomycetota bacterium]